MECRALCAPLKCKINLPGMQQWRTIIQKNCAYNGPHKHCYSSWNETADDVQTPARGTTWLHDPHNPRKHSVSSVGHASTGTDGYKSPEWKPHAKTLQQRNSKYNEKDANSLIHHNLSGIILWKECLTSGARRGFVLPPTKKMWSHHGGMWVTPNKAKKANHGVAIIVVQEF